MVTVRYAKRYNVALNSIRIRRIQFDSGARAVEHSEGDEAVTVRYAINIPKRKLACSEFLYSAQFTQSSFLCCGGR